MLEILGSGVGLDGMVRCDVESFGIPIGGIGGSRKLLGLKALDGDGLDALVRSGHPWVSFGGVANDTTLIEKVTSESGCVDVGLGPGQPDIGNPEVGRLGISRDPGGLKTEKEPSEGCPGCLVVLLESNFREGTGPQLAKVLKSIICQPFDNPSLQVSLGAHLLARN